MSESAPKPWVTEGGKDWLLYQIRRRGNDYSEKFTADIFLPNHFSSSTLTYSLEKQVAMKFGLKEPSNEKEIAGQALHAWLQSKLSGTYTCDTEVRYRIPFQWKSIPYDEIVIIGHFDAASLIDKNLLEYKTSFGKDANGRIHEYQLRQVAFYWLALKEKTGIDVDCRVVKIWSNGNEGGVTEHTLTPDEKAIYSTSLIDRAILCAQKLDDLYLAKGTKPFGTATQIREEIESLFKSAPMAKK